MFFLVIGGGRVGRRNDVADIGEGGGGGGAVGHGLGGSEAHIVVAALGFEEIEEGGAAFLIGVGDALESVTALTVAAHGVTVKSVNLTMTDQRICIV